MFAHFFFLRACCCPLPFFFCGYVFLIFSSPFSCFCFLCFWFCCFFFSVCFLLFFCSV
ncbi:hypothetical protein BC829DRAFT_393435 [Chytridium lagenaria]|nr:hypothetical protein BC829DRAFT_393435 [Chytridium lagenaria]